MFIERKRKIPYIEALIAFALYLFHYTSLVDITVYTASPFILLPLLVAVAMFRGELVGLIFGAVCGFACDAVSSQTMCFNTLAFMFTGFFVGLLAKNIFNRNFPAAIVLSVLTCAAYFFIKWCIYYLLPDIQGKVYYLLWHLAPSALYTAIFIIPFYFLEKRLLREKKPD
ncbi:MAG: rod shape-determining protein MreD [Acutalibacteraceae bacterium]|nr:rod shape-determining protein MreD [Acutalibacteraceae bacterium]